MKKVMKEVGLDAGIDGVRRYVGDVIELASRPGPMREIERTIRVCGSRREEVMAHVVVMAVAELDTARPFLLDRVGPAREGGTPGGWTGAGEAVLEVVALALGEAFEPAGVRATREAAREQGCRPCDVVAAYVVDRIGELFPLLPVAMMVGRTGRD